MIALDLPHPIIFLYDADNGQMEIPEYVDGKTIASNRTCVSVGTQASVDGPVTLRLVKKAPKEIVESFIQIFEGVIDSPKKTLSIFTSEGASALEINVRTNHPNIIVWVDNIDVPGSVCIEAN
ncbi:hypothetical protein [Sulfidibacter corallicola]|uniref:Uncharacterized protein n=1 Tax=Sulfidibacter corallicola TaxID=2818388 RepID=A0A8A4TJG6_SULCO|nr:hypothetical protein [Sulfidibacter corallicola]QTD49690.1 hypothetical protein J3U87_29250 [Sulfidibacter corallicola]